MTKFNFPLKIFIFYFLSTLTIGILVQYLILPIIFPHLHAGNGLLIKGDWNTFHMYAVQLKNLIDKEGWSNYNIFYKGQSPAGIAGFFYKLIYPKPFSLLPINCFFHSLGGLALFLILKNLSYSNFISFLSSSIFVFLPSSLLWYTQIHKDTFYHPGTLIFLLSWLYLISFIQGKRNNFLFISSTLLIFSLIIIYISRSYYLTVFSLVIIIFTILTFFYIVIKISNKKSNLSKLDIIKIFIFFVISNSAIFFTQVNDFSKSTGYANAVYSSSNIEFKIDDQIQTKSENKLQKKIITPKHGDNTAKDLIEILNLCIDGKITIINQGKKETRSCKNYIRVKWESNSLIPYRVDSLLKQLFLYREYFFLKQADANMTFGQDYPLNNITKMLRYIPMAYQYGYLSPFPNSWFKSGSTEATSKMRMIVSVEIILFYILAPLILFVIIKNIFRLQFLLIFIFCNIFILLPTYILPNVGVLMRHRYACYALLMSIGFSFLLKQIFKRKYESWNHK